MIAIALLLAAAAPPFQVSSPAPPGAACHRYDMTGFFREIDRNHDRRITRAEWKVSGAPASAFGALAGKAKTVTAASFAQTTAPPGPIDADGNCRITVAEMIAFDRAMATPAK